MKALDQQMPEWFTKRRTRASACASLRWSDFFAMTPLADSPRI